MADKRAGDDKSPRTMVEDEQGRRPFMRGIMVHSLMSRGASFDDAYRSATAIRDKIRGREVVKRDEIASMVDELLGGSIEERPVDLPPTIDVLEGAKRTPFSKGVLAQSLLAAAMAPDEAFRSAQEIEATLHSRGVREIDRGALRRLVYQNLEHSSQRVAARYQVWRGFEEAGQPMILLLAGAAGVGKTSLAQEVSHRLGISRVVSTDAIRQVMRIMLSKELVPAIHASSYDAYREIAGIEQSDDPVVDAFRQQATTVSIGVKAMMDRAVEENTSMILEGVSILPGLIDPDDWRGSAHVIFLAVATLDEEAFDGRFSARADSGGRRPKHRYLENLDSILRIQDHVLELADHHGLPIVDNDSFDGSVLSILRHVTESLRKQGEPNEEPQGA